MSLALINRDSINRLIKEGYEVQVFYAGYLLVKGIPYLNSDGNVITDGVLGTPLNNIGDHVAYWAGSTPCDVFGNEIKNLIHERNNPNNLLQIPKCDIVFRFSFSNKPDGGFHNYYDKMVSYINIIVAPACSKDPSVSPKTFKPSVWEDYSSPMKYQDVCSLRYNLLSWNDKLKKEKVGIIGLGGTGSYLLDFLSKTQVEEIHLFDDDFFETHNAFRAPGAWTAEELEKRELKVNIFSKQYSKLRKGIVPHPYRINAERVNEFKELGITSLFICIDSGKARKLIVDFAQYHGISCIDCGIDAAFRPDDRISGSVRTTCILSNVDYSKRLQLADLNDDALDMYSTNIQISEFNALNAVLAIILWKQKKGLYVYSQNIAEINYSSETGFSVIDAEELPK